MWKIKHIFDGDYGCEERFENEDQKVTVILVNENDEKKIVKAMNGLNSRRSVCKGAFVEVKDMMMFLKLRNI